MKSMDVLKDMPEAEDRAATLRELQERLETLLKPKLLEVRELLPLTLLGMLRERCVVEGSKSTVCSQELNGLVC